MQFVQKVTQLGLIPNGVELGGGGQTRAGMGIKVFRN